MKNIILSIMTIGLLTGCVSNGVAFGVSAIGLWIASNTGDEVKVILLPEEDGKVGAISLMDNKGVEHIIDKPYTALEINNNGSINDTVLNEQEIISKYGDLLKAIPKKLKNYYFFFDTGSSSLTETQIKEIKEIAKTISSNTIHKVTCIGHSDSTGSDEINEKISKNRAQTVANELIANGIDKTLITVKYYGDANPLVKTKPNESNYKNRRVEIVLK